MALALDSKAAPDAQALALPFADGEELTLKDEGRQALTCALDRPAVANVQRVLRAELVHR